MSMFEESLRVYQKVCPDNWSAVIFRFLKIFIKEF